MQELQSGREGSEGRSISHVWGESFRELSPFIEGSSTQRIDWSKLMTHGELIVKSYDLPQRSTLSILLDETASMSTGQQSYFARLLCIKLAIGVLKAGHHVQLLIDRDENIQSSQVITRLDQFKPLWDRVISHPSGGGASIAQRQTVFNQHLASNLLVCLSDAIVTTQTSTSNSQTSETLISVLDQLKGRMIRGQKILYICLIDEEADRVPINQILTSSEYKDTPSRGPISSQRVEQVMALIEQYRQTQKTLLKSHSQSSWVDYRVQESIEIQFKQIVKNIYLL